MNALIGKKFLFFIGISFFLLACESDSIPAAEPELRFPGVDEALWEYFERFETEGKNRGYDIDIRARGITGEIESIDEDHVAGLCNFSSRAPNHIVIDDKFWKETPPQYLEMIVFHELGHCYLNQDHREEVLDRNICASIMRSGVEDCYDNYTSSTRSYYLDELFDFDSFGR